MTVWFAEDFLCHHWHGKATGDRGEPLEYPDAAVQTLLMRLTGMALPVQDHSKCRGARSAWRWSFRGGNGRCLGWCPPGESRDRKVLPLIDSCTNARETLSYFGRSWMPRSRMPASFQRLCHVSAHQYPDLAFERILDGIVGVSAWVDEAEAEIVFTLDLVGGRDLSVCVEHVHRHVVDEIRAHVGVRLPVAQGEYHARSCASNLGIADDFRHRRSRRNG
ncbi:transposase [Methylococcus capsulatus]|nr:transposase [Methylococcus capsulatus]